MKQWSSALTQRTSSLLKTSRDCLGRRISLWNWNSLLLICLTTLLSANKELRDPLWWRKEPTPMIGNTLERWIFPWSMTSCHQKDQSTQCTTRRPIGTWSITILKIEMMKRKWIRKWRRKVSLSWPLQFIPSILPKSLILVSVLTDFTSR